MAEDIPNGGDASSTSTVHESSDATAPETTLPLKRRNGKQPSCEPCRKAKVSCDHAKPKCGRCVKKAIEAECIYHPAPLTRPVNGSSPHGPTNSLTASLPNGASTRVTKSNGSRSRRSSPSRSLGSDQAASNLLLMLSQQRTPVSQGQQQEEPSDGEYLGPTNYAAIFRETETQIGRDLWRSETAAEDKQTPRTTSASVYTPNCSTTSVEVGIQILEKWPDQETCERLARRFNHPCGIWMHEPSLIFALRQIWSVWGANLRSGNLRPIAEKLIQTPPVSARSCRTSAQWVESFTGDNLRFDMIGVLLAIFSMSAMTLPVWDTLFEPEKHGRNGKRLYAERLGEAADACYDLCSDQATATEPFIWLLYYVQLAQSQYRGDDDGFLWHKSGHIASAITSFGLHREGFIDSAPLMVAQVRRKTFATAYMADKQLATYTGRPPRLSKRFCSCQLPLDLSDEEIMAEGEQLQRNLASLDENGWNKDGKIRPVSAIRLLMLASMVRDELLELCLGPSSDVSRARKQEFRDRAEASYLGVPKQYLLPWDEDAILSSDTPLLLIQLFFHLEHVFDLFLIERIPSKDKTVEDSNTLINAAIKVLDVLEFMQRYQSKMESQLIGEGWFLVYYFLPCASLLSLELLKQHQYPRRYNSDLPRADAVRLLHLYLLGLDMVGPEEGNYKICRRMHKVVTRILKEVLDPHASTWDETPNTQTTPGSYQIMPDIDFTAVMGPNDDPEFTDWFQSVDWAKAPWMDPIVGI